MKIIYKYRIQAEIKMPKGAKIIKAGFDENHIACIWAIVNVNRKPETRYFELYKTGEGIPPSRIYIGTIPMHDKEKYFLHIFEIKKATMIFEKYGPFIVDYEHLLTL